jgi:hypothetical protein
MARQVASKLGKFVAASIGLTLGGSACATSPDTSSVTTFEGGLYDGLRFQRILREDGTQSFDLLPALPGASPPKAELLPVLEGLVRALHTGRQLDFQAVATPDAQIAMAFAGCRLPHAVSDAPPCALQPIHEIVFGEECTAGAPYSLPEDMVRIEWTCGEDLSYITWFTFAGNRVRSGEINVAAVPGFVGQ